jgi:hypothetical protein
MLNPDYIAGGHGGGLDIGCEPDERGHADERGSE